MTINACLICGDERATRFGMVRWKSGTPQYTAGPRCIDRTACRQRVEASGEEWDVAGAQDRAIRERAIVAAREGTP